MEDTHLELGHGTNRLVLLPVIYTTQPDGANHTHYHHVTITLMEHSHHALDQLQLHHAKNHAFLHTQLHMPKISTKVQTHTA